MWIPSREEKKWCAGIKGELREVLKKIRHICLIFLIKSPKPSNSVSSWEWGEIQEIFSVLYLHFMIKYNLVFDYY